MPGPGRYPSKGTFGQFENALKGPKSKGFSFTKKPFPPRMEDSKPLELKIPRDFDTDGKKGFVGLKQSFVFTGKPRDKQMEADTRNYFKDPNSLSTMDPKKTKKGFSFSSRHRVPRGDDEYADPTKQKDFDPMLSFMRVHSKAVKGKKGECFGRSAVMLFRCSAALLVLASVLLSLCCLLSLSLFFLVRWPNIQPLHIQAAIHNSAIHPHRLHG